MTAWDIAGALTGLTALMAMVTMGLFIYWGYKEYTRVDATGEVPNMLDKYDSLVYTEKYVNDAELLLDGE